VLGEAVASVPLTTPDLWLTGAERGLMLAGLALALGGLAGRGLARHYKGYRPGPLPGPWALRGSLLGAAACAALLITAVTGPGLAAQLARPNPPGLRSGGTAEIAAIELVLFALAAVLSRLRRSGSAAVLLSGVVIAEGIRSHPEGVVPAAGALVTYCHVFPALLWAGMLFYAVRSAIAWRAHPAAVRGVVGLYATAAAWLFAVVVVTGVISALVLVPLGSLFTTAYGLFLLAKAVVVGIAAAAAVAGRMWLRRQSVAGSGPARATKLEVIALAAVIAITGILTVLTPPAKSISAQSAPPGQTAALRFDAPAHQLWPADEPPAFS
jgi:copper transport protein